MTQSTVVEKLKKSTTRFAAAEIQKTANSIGSLKVLVLEIFFAVAMGLTIAYGYVLYGI